MAQDPERGFRQRYRGPLHPDDALWWLDHPDEPAPSGRRPPWLPSVVERRSLFARDADPDVVRRIAAGVALRTPLLAEIEAAAGLDSPPATASAPRFPVRRVAWFGTLLVVACVLGSVAGALLPRPLPAAIALDRLDVQPSRAGTASGSTRPLGSIRDPSVRLYSTTQTGELCLTAVEEDGTTASACAPPDRVRDAGVELDLVVDGTGPRAAARDLVLRWRNRGVPAAAETP